MTERLRRYEFFAGDESTGRREDILNDGIGNGERRFGWFDGRDSRLSAFDFLEIGKGVGRGVVDSSAVDVDVNLRISTVVGFNTVALNASERHGSAGAVSVPDKSFVHGENGVGSASDVVHVHASNLVNDLVGPVSIESEDVVDVLNATGADEILVLCVGNEVGLHLFWFKRVEEENLFQF